MKHEDGQHVLPLMPALYAIGAVSALEVSNNCQTQCVMLILSYNFQWCRPQWGWGSKRI
jgi:hypothetical protein